MSAELAVEFFSSVRSNPDAVSRLSGCRNSDEFIDRAAVLCGELGYALERDHIALALRNAEAEYASKASVLSDADLDAVQGGFSWEMMFRPEGD